MALEKLWGGIEYSADVLGLILSTGDTTALTLRNFQLWKTDLEGTELEQVPIISIISDGNPVTDLTVFDPFTTIPSIEITIAINFYDLGSYTLHFDVYDDNIFQVQMTYQMMMNGKISPESLTGETSLKSYNNRKTEDNMNLQEFKQIAAERLETDNIRIDSMVIDFETNGDEKTINLTELNDNMRATAYIKRCNAFVTTEGLPSIKVVDNFKGQNKTIYESITGDKEISFLGMIADKIIIDGVLKGQIIIYTAERHN